MEKLEHITIIEFGGLRNNRAVYRTYKTMGLIYNFTIMIKSIKSKYYNFNLNQRIYDEKI